MLRIIIFVMVLVLGQFNMADYLGVLPALTNSGDLGRSLGTGIGKALEGLARGKLQRIKNQQMERDLLEIALFLQKEQQAKEQEAINKRYSFIIQNYEKYYQLGVQIVQLADELDVLNDEVEENEWWSPWAESAAQSIKSLTKGLINVLVLAGEKAEVFRIKSNKIFKIVANVINHFASKFCVDIKEASKPSLNQSYEARKHNIADLRKRGQILQIPYANTQSILEDNEGNIPKTFGQQVLPRIKQQIESLYK